MSKITRRLFLTTGSAAAVIAQSDFVQARWSTTVGGPIQLFFLDDQGSTLVDDRGKKLSTASPLAADKSPRENQLIRISEALIDNLWL